MPVKPNEALIRASALLAVLAEDPAEDYSLAELARRITINKTTTLSLLLGLADVGWVTRKEPGPTYRLGPGLIPLGTAASSSLEVLSAARPELEALTAELGMTSTAAALAGQEMVILAVEGDPHPLGWAIHAGQRLPLRYPAGSLHMAWRSEAEIDRWLDTAIPPITAERSRHHEVIREVRSRRYSVVIVDPQTDAADPSDLDSRRTYERELHAEYVSGMETSGQTVQLMTIAAPVFDSNQSVVLSMSLCGLPYTAHVSEISTLGTKLRAVADRVTAACGGVIPSAADGPDAVASH